MRGVLEVTDRGFARTAVVLRNEDAMGDATMEVYMRLGGSKMLVDDYGPLLEGGAGSA